MMWSATILTLLSGIYGLLNKYAGTNIKTSPEEQWEGLFKYFNKFIPGMGDALYKGIASITFKVDLSALFAQSAPIEEPFINSPIEMIGGAPASAITDISQGKAPRVGRGFQRSERYTKEGVKAGSRKLLPPEEITAQDKLKLKLGFTPEKISEAYSKEGHRKFTSKQYTTEIRNKVSNKIIPLIEQGKSKEALSEFQKIYDEAKNDDVFTEGQKKTIRSLYGFISQFVLTRLNEEDRNIIRSWKNRGKGYRNNRPSSRSSSSRPGRR